MDVTSTGKLRRTLRAAAPPPRGGTRPRPTAAAPRALLALLTAATLLGAPGAAANSIDDLPMERLNVWIDRDEIQQFVGESELSTSEVCFITAVSVCACVCERCCCPCCLVLWSPLSATSHSSLSQVE